MGKFSQFPLQKSIYQVLINDATLMGMVTGVFDRPPQNTAFPYITIGDSINHDWSTQTSSGMEEIFTLHIWSREGGRKEAFSLMERIYGLLHDASPEVDDAELVMLRFLTSSITLQNDGWTYNGMMQFRALLEI